MILHQTTIFSCYSYQWSILEVNECTLKPNFNVLTTNCSSKSLGTQKHCRRVSLWKADVTLLRKQILQAPSNALICIIGHFRWGTVWGLGTVTHSSSLYLLNRTYFCMHMHYTRREFHCSNQMFQLSHDIARKMGGGNQSLTYAHGQECSETNSIFESESFCFCHCDMVPSTKSTLENCAIK